MPLVHKLLSRCYDYGTGIEADGHWVRVRRVQRVSIHTIYVKSPRSSFDILSECQFFGLLRPL